MCNHDLKSLHKVPRASPLIIKIRTRLAQAVQGAGRKKRSSSSHAHAPTSTLSISWPGFTSIFCVLRPDDAGAAVLVPCSTRGPVCASHPHSSYAASLTSLFSAGPSLSRSLPLDSRGTFQNEEISALLLPPFKYRPRPPYRPKLAVNQPLIAPNFSNFWAFFVYDESRDGQKRRQ
ncbi:unnamed protein product [Caenorhabditis auriculariae]|uniref:Uncharacterized protein n=1 Tax=Caenorhabditis auriculariae TaxID=2777116 RepID=A0A8S1HLQ7_9PELO|nr:unnamed protein product [Caenorhabditis auriculariae]